jgi:hypothetical protein
MIAGRAKSQENVLWRQAGMVQQLRVPGVTRLGSALWFTMSDFTFDETNRHSHRGADQDSGIQCAGQD